MKLPSESVVLGVVAFVSVAIICFSGVAMEYGWFEDGVQEASYTVSNGVSKKEESFSYSYVNVNTATVEQLSELPGMNEALAKRVVWYRYQEGEFSDFSQLLSVEGMNEDILFLIRPFIVFE